MRITRLKIKNFRCLKELDLELTNSTVLVGPNNVGKSAILDAICLVLTRKWGQKGTGFTEYDVFLADPAADPRKVGPAVVQITVSESEGDIWPEELVADLDNVLQVHPQTGHRSIILEVVFQWSEEAGSFEPEWRFLNIAELSLAAGRRVMNTYDFFAYLPTFHLGPLRDASDEFSPRSQFWGRLLKAMKIPPKLEEEVAKSLIDLNDKLLDADPRLRKIAKTLDSLQSISASDQPGGVNLRMLPFDMWDMLSRAEIVAQNEKASPWLPLVRHGQGMQSLSVILLFKAFIEHALSEYYKPEATPVLTLEEPEAHLHPQAARALWREVDLLPGQRVVATHSPYFIQETPLRDIRWVRMTADGTSVKYLPKSFSAGVEQTPELMKVVSDSGGVLEHNGAGSVLTVNGKLSEKLYRSICAAFGTHPKKDEILAVIKDLKERSLFFVSDENLHDLEGSAKRIRGEIFFARKWILVEGQTEYLLIQGCADAMGRPLDPKGVSVIDFQNNGSPGLFVEVAAALDIPWRLVCDGDAAGTDFQKQVATKNIDAATLTAQFTLLPNGTIEEQLLHDGLEPELREIADELNLTDAKTVPVAALLTFLCNNKVAYAQKLSARIRLEPDLCKKMPDAFKKAIEAFA